MPQHQFVGDAEPERAEAEFLKAANLAQAEEQTVVREMAETLKEEATSLHTPTSIREGVELLKELRTPEAREELREKARERLEKMPDELREQVRKMPQPVQFAFQVAERTVELLRKPAGKAIKLVSDALRVPGALYKILTHREA